MELLVQFLEGGSYPTYPSADEVRQRLLRSAGHLPFSSLLLGWDLPPGLVEACAEVCAALRIDLYLWVPLLCGHGRFRPDPAWQVIGLAGQPVGGHADALEFTFLCPNQPAARAAALKELEAAVGAGPYQGVFLDRIRFPSPAANPARDLGCFCDGCRQAAGRMGLDLGSIQRDLRQHMDTPQGRRDVARSLLSHRDSDPSQATLPAIRDLMAFRQTSISAAVGAAAESARGRGLQVGLDCFTPTLAGTVGQDLTALDRYADWIKVMTYARAYGPASLPFEVLGLVDWLTSGGEPEPDARNQLAMAAGWPLPAHRDSIRRDGLPSDVLTIEIRRGRAMGVTRLLAGIELVEVPGVSELQPAQMRADAEAVVAAVPDGVVFSWDLWRMPEERLTLAAALFGHRSSRRR